MQLIVNPVLPNKQKNKNVRFQKNSDEKASLPIQKDFQLPRYNQVDKNFQKTNINKKLGFGSVSIEKSLKQIENLMKENSGIAGYLDVRNKLYETLLCPIVESIYGTDYIKMPGVVILCGPTGTGKKTLLNEIAEKVKDHANVINISSIVAAPNFSEALIKELEQSKQRYKDTGKRTILVMDGPESFLSFNKSDIPMLGIKLDKYDENMLDANGNNRKNVCMFKFLLGDVAKIPAKNDPPDSCKSAATFFFTTNHPHLIDPSFITTHKGNFQKIVVDVASDNNLTEVLKFHFQKMSKVADAIKGLKHNPDYREVIDGLAGISNSAKYFIKEMIADGTIDKLHVDHENMPYSKLAKYLNPNKKEGAYSNDRLRFITNEAFKNYLTENPSKNDFKSSLFKVLMNTKRDISPEIYQKWQSTKKSMKCRSEDYIDKIEILLLQREIGLMTAKEANILNVNTKELKARLNRLKKSEAEGLLIREDVLQEKARLEELLRQINADENPEK